MSGKPEGNLHLVRGMLDAAEPVGAAAPADDVPPPDVNEADQGEAGGNERGPRGRRPQRLPEDCPVKPLGINGKTYFYLDAANQLKANTAREHGRLDLLDLFGQQQHKVYDWWGRTNDKGAVVGWRPEFCAEALMSACAARGVWNFEERVRGAGAWRGADGELILHNGDEIQIGEQLLHPGLIGDYVYPADAPKPRPARQAQPAEHGPGERLLALLGSWAWKRGALDAQLMLGWIGCAMIGGALDWRPAAWITGGKGTGKSTLHKLLALLFEDGLISVADTTAAGIWQKLRHRSLPVAIDELEASEDNRKIQAVVSLARMAASGGRLLRGGAEHDGAEFTMRSAFMFSSINIPPLLGQDKSRMAVLELNKLPADATVPVLKPADMRALGSGVRRRLVDQWARIDETIALYRDAMEKAGHTARGADQFGTLMAVADLLLADELPEQPVVSGWAERLDAAALAELDDVGADEDSMLGHLFSSIVDPFRNGGRATLGHWVQQASLPLGDQTQGADANKILQTFGLKILFNKFTRDPEHLAVANQHQGLSSLFQGTHWGARSGAAGVWVQAAQRLPGAERGPAIYFAGVTAKATLVPWAVIQKRVSEAKAVAQPAPDLLGAVP